jgi:hypothetical protein
MKKQLVILILIGMYLTGQYTFGQISEGGTPISFSLEIDTEKVKTPVLVMPPVDARALLQEDETMRKEYPQMERPFRFGYAIDVHIDIKKTA